MTKVEAVVTRERVETVIDAVEAATGHVGVTVMEAIGHGRQRGVTHEYRGRVFESRFLPKALLTFVVEDSLARAVVDAIVDAARSGHESGDGVVWTMPIQNVTHNRTGLALGEVEKNGGTHGFPVGPLLHGPRGTAEARAALGQSPAPPDISRSDANSQRERT
ncbi:MAG TPA: P-II family nitrogen regulator [Gaiellaceae bacterium]|nr:P-II family nitrogen regulator [Gaiellaceae bacterium]